MRLITEQREFARIPLQIAVQWQRISAEEYERRKPLFAQYATRERQRSYFPLTDLPNLPVDSARPAELAILQSLRQLHQKLDRLMGLIQPQQVNDRFQGETVDLSASGMRLVTEQEIERGDHLILSFALPGGPPRASGAPPLWGQPANVIEVLARTVSSSTSENTWTASIRFTAIYPLDQQEIQQYCLLFLGR